MLNSPIDIIRYLFILRVNNSLVWAPRYLSTEFSAVLGAAIAERLPTRRARPWRKTMAPWGSDLASVHTRRDFRKIMLEKPWPIDAVLFWHPNQRTFGKGAPILLELKLLGDSADHDMFLEVILPTMEYLGATLKCGDRQSTSIWGHFDIQSVYTAKGPAWKPLIRDGKLDLRRKVYATQWRRGLTFTPRAPAPPRHMTWLTTFDIPGCGARRGPDKRLTLKRPPSLQSILEAYLERMNRLLANGRRSAEEVKAMLDLDGEASLDEALAMAARIPVLKYAITEAPGRSPAPWTGSQTFAAPIPREILPYLGLASLLHIGPGAHYGCGTFTLD